MAHTPELWHHVTQTVHFMLVVDDFGIKSVGKQYLDNLIDAIKIARYRITLELNHKQRYVDISMPGYVKKIIV